MSEPKLISPLLDNFAMGDPISDQGGIRICPAMDKDTGDKYIVKIFSNPAAASKLDALVLTGAYADRTQALQYYRSVAQDIMNEVQLLNKLSELDGFLPCKGSQLEENEDESGYDVYTLTPYRMSLDRYWVKNPMTHLSALNLGLDLCSALTVCRRCGYIFVGLQPENIYYTDDKGFKIGDIGFMALDSLKYASLPDRYRSTYTPPEIEDAFASIDTTIDVYAVGLILYQIFNAGTLPDLTAAALPSPEFADYEIGEIILKACDKDPSARWADPAQMGQALVDYMQRNGAHDTLIVPPPVEIPAAVAVEHAENPDIPQEEDILEAAEKEHDQTEPVEENAVPDHPAETDDHSQVEEAILETENAPITEEVSDMLSQADELIAHEAPAPVIQPMPIDVQLPAQAPDEQSNEVPNDTADQEIPADSPQEDQQNAAEDTSEPVQEEVTEEASAEQQSNQPSQENYYDDDDDYDYAPTRKSHWLRNTLIALVILSLLVGGFIFYKYYYLQHIDSLELTGKDLSLTVEIQTKADESLLTVTCYDTYGNRYTSPVENGIAEFKDLAPDCAYTVEVSIKGLHKLTGFTANRHTTPRQTSVVQFTAKTGAEDGSVNLSFSVEGPAVDNWIIRRSADGEAAEDIPCSEHSYTITGLTVGKAYTFELLAANGKQIIGETKLTHTASNVIKAIDPKITSYQDGAITVVWGAPEGTQVSSWDVYCFNDRGYSKHTTCADLTATFEEITSSDPYTIEITANGMSVCQPVYIPENAVSVSNFAVTKTDSTSITLSWTNGYNTPENGWILQYSIDGTPVKEIKTNNADSAKLTPYIPGCNYSFTLLTADSGDVIGGEATYTTDEADDFSGYSIKRSNMKFKMCLTPNVSNWTRKNLRTSDYTTTFKANQRASFLVYINKKYGVSSNKIYVTYVIRDSENNLVTYSTTETKWSNMWKGGYGEFDLPTLPKTSGQYSVTVYFNDAIAGQQNFKIK